MCFVNNKIQHEPLTDSTITVIFVFDQCKIVMFKISAENFEFGKYFLDLLEKIEKIFFWFQMQNF